MSYNPPPTADSSSLPTHHYYDDRPLTSHTRPPSSSGSQAFYYRDPQYTYNTEGPIEEEDESEDEDVFAYLPPTTAEQEKEREDQERRQHELADAALEAKEKTIQHDPSGVEKEQEGGQSISRSIPSPPPTSVSFQHPPSPTPPAPTFDPHSRTYHPSNPYHPGNFNVHDVASPTSASPFVAQAPFTPPFAHLPVESPPSTSSQPDSDNPYRMRRIDDGTLTPSTLPPTTANASTAPPSTGRFSIGRRRGGTKGVHVDLPKHEKERPQSVDSAGVSVSAMGSASASVSVTPSMMDFVDSESRDGSIKMEFDFDAIDEEDSPYAEVRASVSNVDDPEMPAMTLRMWVIGLILCMIGSAMNVFFNFRQPAPQVVPLVLVLVSYPIGKLAAYTLPIRRYRWHSPAIVLVRTGETKLWKRYKLARRDFEYVFSLNPGPWNIKEHVLVYIMANVAVGPPYALNAIVVSEIFYDIKLGFWFNLVLVLATQLTGFGLAGLCRRFLVFPASMVWPQNLVTCTLLNTLHAEDDEESDGLSRYKFYVYGTLGAFFFFFFPGFIFTALSLFSWVCWIAPKNVPLNQLFGVASGLGMTVLTFDWTQISWIGSPLMVPWWAEVHVFFGFVLFYWILTPILYYTNVWQLSHFPISANEPYDRFGNVYNVTRLLQEDNTFNLTAYEEYSPLYLPATYAMTYLLAFALSTCVIVHTLLYHGRSLLNGLKNLKVEKDDIHAKLMRNYPEVPDIWYSFAFVLFFSLAIVAAEVWDTGVPVWALLLSVALPILYILPSGFIFAMTGQGITLNLLAQIIPGTVLPGNPLANMVFKAYSVQTLTEATMFVQDLKLGHYIKVPPKATFLVQSLATIMAAFIQVGVKEWLFTNVKDICHPNQVSSLTCPHNQVFFTASAVWGLIGPNRQFGAGSIYHPQLYAIIIGALLPLPFWLWQRRHPESWIRYVSTPIILNGVSFIPPATGINYSSWFAVGFIFQYLIRRRNFGWWSKFNYVTSAALDSGTVISLIFIFFTLQFPKGGRLTLNWWGNTVYLDTADIKRLPLRQAPPEGL